MTTLDVRTDTQLLMDGDRLRKAEAVSRRALWQQPVSARDRVILAMGCLTRGDDTESIRLLRQALYDDPSLYQSYDLLVEIYRSNGRFDDASDVYDAWAAAVFESERANR